MPRRTDSTIPPPSSRANSPPVETNTGVEEVSFARLGDAATQPHQEEHVIDLVDELQQHVSDLFQLYN